MKLAVPVALLITSASATAAAQRQSPPYDRGAAAQERPARVPELSDLRLNAGLGVGGGDTLDGGLAASLLATYRYSFVEGGLLLEGGNELFGGSYGLIAGALGPVLQTSSGPRLELLGVAGRSGYSGVNCGLFCDGGGASAELPFVGARAGFSYVVKSRKRAHLELGAAVMYGSDLRRKHVDYVTYGDLFDGDQPTPGSTTVGGRRSSAMFVFGTNFDVGG